MRVFFTQTIELYRLIDASNKESYERQNDIKGFIAPVGAEDVMLTDGNPAQSFKLMTERTADVKKTDKLIWNDESYVVTGIQEHRFGALSRKNIMLEKFNS